MPAGVEQEEQQVVDIVGAVSDEMRYTIFYKRGSRRLRFVEIAFLEDFCPSLLSIHFIGIPSRPP